MSSNPAPPTTPPTSTAVPEAAPQAPQAPPASTSAGQWFRNLSPFTKGACVAVLILLAAAWYIFAGRVSTDDAQVDCHITAVAPQVPGYVVQLLINDNTPVKQGDLLVQIDARPYEEEVEQDRHTLVCGEEKANSAKLQITLTRETTTHNTGGATAQKESDAADYASSQVQLEQTATANLQVAEANVAAKKATNDRAQSDLARYTPLLITDDVSKYQFDAVDAAARVAKSELLAAQQQLAAAQQAVDIAKANTRSSQARLSRSQSLLLQTKAQEPE